MIESSKLQVFSIYYNIKKFINRKKPINTCDVYKLTSIFHFNNVAEFTKKRCFTIYNEIENGNYTYTDLAIFITYEYMFYGGFKWENVNIKNINIVKELFSYERLLIDQQFIIDLNEKTKFDKLSEYFKITNDGVSIIFNLITDKKRFISPYFFIKYQKLITNENNTILDDYYEEFIKIIKLFTIILNTKN